MFLVFRRLAGGSSVSSKHWRNVVLVPRLCANFIARRCFLFPLKIFFAVQLPKSVYLYLRTFYLTFFREIFSPNNAKCLAFYRPSILKRPNFFIFTARKKTNCECARSIMLMIAHLVYHLFFKTNILRSLNSQL